MYDTGFLAWWGVLLFVLKLGSRRQLDYDLRDMETRVLDNVNRLAETHQETLPVAGTLDHFLGHVGATPFGDVQRAMVSRLIRMKALDEARLDGRFVVVVDGTGWLVFDRPHCERCLTQRHGDVTTYMHAVLEAKLLGPGGMALSVGTQFIENLEGPDCAHLPNTERAKQDCELKALERLARDLKRAFPQLPICLAGDALFACGPAIALAKNHGWSYVFTFKEGRLPTLWSEFQRLLPLCPENVKSLTLPDGAHQELRWVNDLVHIDDQGRSHTVSALQCTETVAGVPTRFAWITDVHLTSRNVVAVSSKGGRNRWKIENEGFNIQKNSEMNLEHPYSNDLENMKAYYYLIQIGHTLLQVLEKGSLLRRLADAFGKSPVGLFGSLANIARRLLEALRCSLLPDDAYDSAAAAEIQIRFTSG